MPYPVEAVLPDLIAHLDGGPNAVLVAPPGAGKTTIVPPALLARPWASGTILLLSPRRLATRAARRPPLCRFTCLYCASCWRR